RATWLTASSTLSLHYALPIYLMEKTFMLEIITPEKQFFTGEVESLIIPAVDGSYGVQAGHEPIVTAIEPGEARYKVDGVWHTAVDRKSTRLNSSHVSISYAVF